MEKRLSAQARVWRDGRRLRAFELKERGWKQRQIADALGVTEGAASRLVRALGLSLQKPARRADQRDEEAIEHWKEDRWPELKRGL